MTDAEKRLHIWAIKCAMRVIKNATNDLIWHVQILEEHGGMDLPNMRETIGTLSEISMGWELQEAL